MGRRPLNEKPMTGAERVAAHTARLRKDGGRVVTAALDRIKQSRGFRTNAEAISWAVHVVARDGGVL
jgi:hypothetical protein